MVLLFSTKWTFIGTNDLEEFVFAGFKDCAERSNGNCSHNDTHMGRLLVHSDINQHSRYYKRALILYVRYYPLNLHVKVKKIDA